MSKKAFTLVELLATIVVIGLIMSIILPSAMRVSEENKDSMYESFEKMMVEYAAVSKYKNQFYVGLDDLEELEKVRQECESGYVLIDHDTNPETYNAYISCGEYQTEGYTAEIFNTKGKIEIPSCVPNLVYSGTYQSLVPVADDKYTLVNGRRKDIGSQNVTVVLNKNLWAWTDNSQDDQLIRGCEIKARTITVTANSVEVRKGAALTITPKIEGKISGEEPFTSGITYKLENSSGNLLELSSNVPVGVYKIRPSTTVSGNYEIKYGNPPGELTVLQSMFVINLNNNSATTSGTQTIYEVYNTGYYSNVEATSSIESITIPKKNGYIFAGYYTQNNGGGTKIINESGSIVANTITFEDDTTIYAKWNECGNGYYCSNNEKTGCPAGTYGNGTKTGSSKSQSCTTCEKGYYCTGINNKTACGAGKYNDLTGQSNASICKPINAGCYGTNGTSNCPAQCTGRNSYSLAGAGSCTTVSTGYYSTGCNGSNNACTGQQICSKGYYCSGGIAYGCGAGKYNNVQGSSSSSACKNINAGCYGTNGTSACPAGCGAGKWSNAGSSSCSNINAGCYGTNGTSACPAGCGAGKWSNAGSSSCSTINAGCYGTNGTSACPAGCGAGKWSNAGSSSCSTINAGCYGTNGTSACPNKCNAGTYSGAGASGCTNCGGGKWSNAGSSSCSTISAGCYGTNGTSACPNKCNAGTYSGAGASGCTNCGGGKWSNAGSSGCSNINAGCYGTNGTSACPASCGGGRWSNAGSSSCGTISAGCYGTSAGSSCPNKCGPGYYSGAGSSSCGVCSYGNYSNGSQNSGCASCPTYYYSGYAATSCYDNSSPWTNSWASTNVVNVYVTAGSATATICSLGGDNGNGLKTIYYRTNCSGWSSASISGGCGRISISSCSGGTLYYYLSDGVNNSGTVTVGGIGQWFILGMVYTQFLWPGGSAPNSSGHIGNWYNLGGYNVSGKVRAISDTAIGNNSGASNTLFVQRLYLGLLGRSYDSSGLNHWVTSLNHGLSRSSVVESFIHSSEARAIYSAWGYS